MTPKQKIELRMSQRRQRMGELLALDEMSAEERAELGTITEGLNGDETELRAATLIEAADASAAQAAADGDGDTDPARVELRNAASLTNFVLHAATGAKLDGADREFAVELGTKPGRIPLEMFTPPAPPAGVETRAVTPAPGTVGVNLDPLLPAIFARSVCNRLGIDMPRVESGTYATGTITTSQTAAARNKSQAIAGTAGAFTVNTTTPHRVSARLEVTLEDIAAVGVGNFESILRQNLMLAMSAELDDLCLNGDNSAPDPHGLLPQLSDPTDPSDVVTWAGFVGAMAAGIDGGPWAEDLMGVRLLVNAETMRLAEQTFQGPSAVGTPNNTYSDTPGELSAAAYLRAHTGGFFASSRMPDTASTIAQALLYRPGTMGLEGVNAMRTAVMPIWADIGIDDIYTGSDKAERYLTFHTLIGDVIITQTSAYTRTDLKVSA